jgi:hypothetical protein
LVDFNRFCEACFGSIRELVVAAFKLQKKRT